MRTSLFSALLGAAFALTACATPAAAQRGELSGINDRLARMERTVAQLQAALNLDDGAAGLQPGGDAASLTVRVSQLERELQELTGRVEELSFKLEQANRRLEAVSQVMANGGQAGSQRPDGFGAQASSGPVDLSSGDPIADRLGAAGAQTRGAAPVELPFDPDAAFEYASGFLLQGDYDRAQEAFELYVEAFPNHPRTPDAQFRLGEIYLATGANADAADAFIKHIRNFPNDPRAAEAYLKLGTAFARLEQPDQACKVFKSMKSKFPNAAPAVMQRADIEMARINCK
ncbi:MAG: tol-pal system protein YbgF [Parvularculaceae bacterium]